MKTTTPTTTTSTRSEFGIKRILVKILYFHLLTTVGGSRGIKSTSGKCALPPEWTGSWSQADFRDDAAPVVINGSGMSVDNLVNSCVASLQDSYIFKEIDGTHPPCYRCRIVSQKHPNVIQYRQSECDDEATFDDCADIPTTNKIVSLYRIDGKNDICPFVGKRMTFGYTTDDRVCSYEASGSHADACSDPSMMSLSYEGCVDVKGSERLREELICVGSWSEHSANYFVAKVVRKTHGHIEEAFRCFTYAEVRRNISSIDVIGYQVSRSGDTGSCREMTPTVGPWTYNFNIVEEKFGAFPHWLDPDHKGESYWTALNLTFEFGIDVAGGKIQMRYTPLNVDTPSNSTNARTRPGYQFTVSKVEYLNESYASLEVIEIVECQRLPICMDLYRRSESVVEVELYHRAVQQDKLISCHHQVKVNPHLTYTLVKVRARPVQCPLTGVFRLDVPPTSSHVVHVQKCTDQVQMGPNQEHFLEIGCGESTGLDFYTECNPGQPLLPSKGLQLVSGLDCVGSWKEGDNKTYIVANNSALGVRGYRCLEVTSTTEDVYSVFISTDDCKPSSARRLKNWTFNANPFSGCDYVLRKENLKSSAGALRNGLVILFCWILPSIFIP